MVRALSFCPNPNPNPRPHIGTPNPKHRCGIRDGAAVVRLIHGLRTLENLDVRSNKLSHDDLIAVHEAAEARGISVLAEDVDAGSPGRDHAPLLPALPPL
mmetsp:Transcript_751/g.1891  ORF Transcript_751/g.1891 Transcript_751/m.1891 type:complete len:100 (-) Transcript_751:101-400(-)